MQYVKLKDALSAVIDKSLDSICFYPASAQHRQPAEGALFYGETCSYAYPLRFLFGGSPVSVSSPFPGVEERGRAVPSAVAEAPPSCLSSLRDERS